MNKEMKRVLKVAKRVCYTIPGNVGYDKRFASDNNVSCIEYHCLTNNGHWIFVDNSNWCEGCKNAIGIGIRLYVKEEE